MTLQVGILIAIPDHMKEIYQRIAVKENRAFEDVAAEDCRIACNLYFDKVMQIKQMIDTHSQGVVN